MLIKNETDKPKKLGVTYMVNETFYRCDGRKAECCDSPECGVKCQFTKDRNHWLLGTIPIIKMAAPMGRGNEV